MTHQAVPFLFSFLLLLLLLGNAAQRIPKRPSRKILAPSLVLVAVALTLLPLGTCPLGGWVMTLLPNVSIPWIFLLLDAAWRSLGGGGFLPARSWRSGWIYGALLGFLLYPAALGLGGWDPYAWGWDSTWLFVPFLLLSLCLLLKNDPFGLVLAAGVAAYNLRILESTNLWDYLLDPIFWTVSCIHGARKLRLLLKGGSPHLRS